MSREDLAQVAHADSDGDPQPDADTSAADAQQGKRKVQGTPPVIAQKTLSKPDWAYVHLRMVTPAALVSSVSATGADQQPVDQLTVYMHIQSALKSFLGLHGTTISYDFLKTEGQNIWLRVHRTDANALVAAVGGWIGGSGEAMRVMNWGCWGPHEGTNGMDLFDE